jgi:predicted ATPase/DNA-binding winged helix-turn-helix (wHTH) protein
LLEKSGVAVCIGSRAFDVLHVLVERATETVSKDDLVERVWPEVIVEETALRVHIARLRKILGDGPGGSKYITTIPGRGYCFTCPVHRTISAADPVLDALPSHVPRSLPPRLRGMVGRDELVAALTGLFLKRRLLSIVGPGGIGKTTVALATADNLLSSFDGSIHFIDLSPLREPRLILNLVARSFGLSVKTENLLPTLVAHLHKRRVLIVFDSCEHVVAEVAGLVDQILRQTSEVFVLATSREALRVAGEYIHRLEPLRTPASDLQITAAEALSFSAIKLFVERITAAAVDFVLDEICTLLIVDICRRLDGIPLAIELVAGHVDAFGISGVANLLDDRLQLSNRGSRTALPRHQTLNAALNWSYQLLSESERRTLRRLSIFVGFFSLEATRAVYAQGDNGDFETSDAIASLVAKSLVSIEFQATTARYRLLDMTRAYAHTKLIDSGEADAIAYRHADHYRSILEEGEARSVAQETDGLMKCAIYLDDIRSALGWAFSSPGAHDLAIALAAAAAPLLLELSLLTECRIWTERAIGMLAPIDRGTRREMVLEMAYGISLISTKGNNLDALTALGRALSIAEGLNDTRIELQLYEALHVTQLRMRNFDEGFATARRANAVAQALPEVEAVPAHFMMGLSYHYSGQHNLATAHLKRAANSSPTAHLTSVRRLGVNFRLSALTMLARILWLQGSCDTSLLAARDVVSEGQVGGNMMSYTMALALLVPVHLWRGDDAIAEEIISRLIDLARRDGLAPTLAVGQGWQGALATLRGKAIDGVRLLRASIQSLTDSNYQITATYFRAFYAVGLAATDDMEPALRSIERAIEETIRDGGDLAYLPELLRIKGSIKIASGHLDSGEASLVAGLAEARRQHAQSWELRVACDLADLWQREGRLDDALALLSPIYDRFTEGFDTSDLRTARLLIENLKAKIAEAVSE